MAFMNVRLKRSGMTGFTVLTVVWFCSLFLISGAPSAQRPVGKAAAPKVENFRLLDHEGRSHELYREGEARAIVLFIGGNGCPIVRQSISTLKTLRERFGSQKVVFKMINANPQDDRASIAEEAKEFAIDFPILKDTTQLVCRSLGVTRTAEAIAIDTKTWTIFYRGAIDNRLDYGTQKARATKNYLVDALTKFLAGEKVSPSQTKVKGCAISFIRESAQKNELR